MQKHEQEIRALLATYFDGLYHSDVDKLAQVFHLQATYCCAEGGTLLHLSMHEYFPIVAARISPASLNQKRVDEVVSIDISGDYTAIVKAKCVIYPKHFTDFLSLIRHQGRWQIIAKVFHFHLSSI